MGEPEAEIARFAARCNAGPSHPMPPRALGNVKPAPVYCGRGKRILSHRAEPKRKEPMTRHPVDMALRRLSLRIVLSLAAAAALAAWTASIAHAEVIVKQGEKIAFLGDSITAQGWTNPHGYVRLVVAGFEANGVKVVPLPAGVGGNRSNDMLARLQRDVLAVQRNLGICAVGLPTHRATKPR